MPLPLLYFAAAGLAAAGGPLAGVYFFRRGAQEAARQEARADAKAIRDLLEQSLDLAELRRRAQEEGVDPDAVAQGYHALKAGYLTVDEFVSKVLSGQAPVPANLRGGPPPLPRGHTVVEATPAEMRAWAIAQGMDVAATGRLPMAVVEAYGQSHAG
jgi:hypothetical protein